MAASTVSQSRCLGERRHAAADLPPCGGDVRQDRGGQRERDRRSVSGFVVAALFLLLPLAPAFAHSALIASDPGRWRGRAGRAQTVRAQLQRAGLAAGAEAHPAGRFVIAARSLCVEGCDAFHRCACAGGGHACAGLARRLGGRPSGRRIADLFGRRAERRRAAGCHRPRRSRGSGGALAEQGRALCRPVLRRRRRFLPGLDRACGRPGEGVHARRASPGACRGAAVGRPARAGRARPAADRLGEARRCGTQVSAPATAIRRLSPLLAAACGDGLLEPAVEADRQAGLGAGARSALAWRLPPAATPPTPRRIG